MYIVWAIHSPFFYILLYGYDEMSLDLPCTKAMTWVLLSLVLFHLFKFFLLTKCWRKMWNQERERDAVIVVIVIAASNRRSSSSNSSNSGSDRRELCFIALYSTSILWRPIHGDQKKRRKKIHSRQNRKTNDCRALLACECVWRRVIHMIPIFLSFILYLFYSPCSFCITRPENFIILPPSILSILSVSLVLFFSSFSAFVRRITKFYTALPSSSHREVVFLLSHSLLRTHFYNVIHSLWMPKSFHILLLVVNSTHVQH